MSEIIEIEFTETSALFVQGGDVKAEATTTDDYLTWLIEALTATYPPAGKVAA